MSFTWATAHWGNNKTFWGLLDTGSELTLTPGDLKKCWGPLVNVGVHGGQEIIGVLAEVWLTVGPVCALSILCLFLQFQDV